MSKHKPELIVALDVDTLEQTQKLIDILEPSVDFFKVGSQLFTSAGPAAVRFILARGKKVFLDLKYHDIPNTVASAVRSAVGLSEAVGNKMSKGAGISMLTVHTQGGEEMLKAAAQAAAEKAKALNLPKPLIVGITVLTSEQRKEGTQKLVLERARLAKSSGLDGVVASIEEAAAICKELGEDFIIVTPGIRPQGSATGDQKRAGTPKDAVRAGSNFLVVGRPIIESSDPLGTAKKILEEIRTD